MDNFLIKIIFTEMISIITERNERMQLLQQLFQGETSRNSIKDYRENTIISANINFNPFIILNFPLNFDQRDTNQKKKATKSANPLPSQWLEIEFTSPSKTILPPVETSIMVPTTSRFTSATDSTFLRVLRENNFPTVSPLN